VRLGTGGCVVRGKSVFRMDEWMVRRGLMNGRANVTTER
jgi:hypothetical protein